MPPVQPYGVISIFLASLALLSLRGQFVAGVPFPQDAPTFGLEALPIVDCPKALPQGQSYGGTYNVSITSGGLARWYLIYIPPSYENKIFAPLILSYHGGTRNASYQLQLDQFTKPEFNQFAITVYPNGIDEIWQGIPGASPSINDILFTSDILEQVQDQYCIDPSRIWASGKSDGGGFCNTLACDPGLSKRIAAFAPVSGAYYVNTTTCNAENVSLPCSPGRDNIPMLEIHGGNDTTINYNGGARKNECLPSIPQFIQQWALRDRLQPTNITSLLTNDTLIYSFGEGDKAGLVAQILSKSIGHDWPSTEPNSDNQQLGHTLASYNATPIIVDFFKKHPLSQALFGIDSELSDETQWDA